MKSLISIAIFYLFILNCIAQRFDVQFMLDGKLRESIVVKPNKAPPVGGYPLVVMLHSSSHDAEEPFSISGWKELGEQENFITVYPSSLKWCITEDGIEKVMAKWVNGNLIEYPCTIPQQYVDDVKFIRTLVTKVIDTFPVNTAKIYASGFSNGSAMVHKLAMEAGDVFAAVAGCGGTLAISDSMLHPENRIPIWFAVGTEDPFFLYSSFTEIPFGEDSVLIYMNKPISRVLACQGLTHQFSKYETAITHTYLFNENQPGQISKPYRFSLIKGMAHMFPNGTNFPIEAARLFWEFFKQNTSSASNHAAEKPAYLNAFPNPSQDKIEFTLSIPSHLFPFNCRVINGQGNIVYSSYNQMSDHFILHKSKIGPGIFTIQIQSGNQIISEKFIFYD